MEEDLEIIEKALLNLEATNSEKDKASNYEGLYKNWGKLGNQEERRNHLLEVQKSNRNNKIDRFRGILELVNAVEDCALFNPYSKVPYKPSIYVAGFHKTSLSYSNVLMLSEWMVEKPGDFSQNWYVVPCPKGVRLLVVANHGTTRFYTKYGHFRFEKNTDLPGGNPHKFNRKSCCVLDCFYYDKTNTMYLLDVLAWNNQPMTDGETEFRQYWIRTQLEDLPDIKTINKNNNVIIKFLPMMPCTDQSLTSLLSNYPQFENNAPPLDGLLFYHKKAHYVAGQTPLVGWLYPYMVPEVLGGDIKLHPGYMQEKPYDYVNQADFILKFEAKNAKKNKWRSSQSDEMETDFNKNESVTETKNTSTTIKQKGKIETKISSTSMDHETIETRDTSTTMEEEDKPDAEDAPATMEQEDKPTDKESTNT